MRIIALLLILSTYSLMTTQAFAEEKKTPSPSLKIEKRQEQSVFTGTLYKIWYKLRALSPVNHTEMAPKKQVIATAGIRGSESTDSLLQLYWKDDRTNDEAFLKEISALNEADSLIENGRLAEGKIALEQFFVQYPGSDLKPNAMLAMALIVSSLGDTQKGISLFKQFIQENPKHPLRTDAENAIKTLSESA